MAPKPSDMAAVRMKRLRLVNGTVEMMRMPEAATELKRKVVRPPNTGFGMATKAAANLEKTPMMIRKKQAAYPAFRLAQRVNAMTPLFCAKVDMGVIVQRPASKPLKPSANTPPWIRESNSLPSTSSLDTSQVAVMSPMASIMRTMYTAINGKIMGPYIVSGNVLTQMKDTAGAASIPDAEKYPVAPAMIQPTRRPTTTAQDFMIGLPKRSQRMMVTKTEKPSFRS